MDLEKIGAFLCQLRRERGLTQEQLGQQLGVTNKTVSRWEKGNYLPPAEMLKLLSEFYGVSINELLSGERLAAEQYRERAEENITAVLHENGVSLRERLRLCGQWLKENWWVVLLCLTPALVFTALRPFVVGDRSRLTVLLLIYWLLFFGMSMAANHLIFHVSRRAYAVTKREQEFGTFRLIRTVWLMLLAGMLFVCTDLLLATLHVLTPAGTADGYHIISIFNDKLIDDSGIYPNNCFESLQQWLWPTFGVLVMNLDMTILWMKKQD